MTLAAATIVCLPAQGSAQDFFRSSPGALSRSHADLDHESKCTKCHEPGGGVTRPLCLGCHEVLNKEIKRGKGLHADPEFKKKCQSCHTEHKGRSAPVSSWKSIGGQSTFDHRRTGFTLQGKHGEISCASCHRNTLPSGLLSYIGTSPVCKDCHGNVHKFTNKSLLNKCESCHPSGVARNLSASDLPFNHDRVAKVPLTGGHAGVRCVACHKKSNMANRKRTCVNCHRHSHGKTFKAWPCTDCHSLDTGWTMPSFDHDKTKMPLRGKHRTTCSRCHKKPRDKPSVACRSCHNDPHKKRFEEIKDCTICHMQGGTTRMQFRHKKMADFALTGRHSKLPCRSCHRGKRPSQFEQFETADCMACHAHTNAHDGQFRDKNCLDCHAEGGSKELDFDHQTDTRFPLVGAHADLEKKGQCKKCHPGGEYRTNKTKCVDCHREDDLHEGKLGENCEKCHEPAPKASLFEHDSMTRFERTGRHATAECASCHRVWPKGEPLPKVGWTAKVPKQDINLKFPVMGKDCAGCHFDVHEGEMGKYCAQCHNTQDFREARGGFHDTGPFRLQGIHDTLPCDACHATRRDLTGQIQTCALCHTQDDEHAGGLGPFCGECHRQHGWRPHIFNHASTGFVLRGAHRSAVCRDCHGVGTYAGTPTECGLCHTQDSATVPDPIHTPEFSECEGCHSEIAFLPARSYHPWFPLEGQHRFVGCSNCHAGGVYAGSPTVCIGCHLNDYLDPTKDRDHVAEGFPTTCEDCHSPAGWLPALEP